MRISKFQGLQSQPKANRPPSPEANQQSSPAPNRVDSFIPADEMIIGMPDPEKYPNWRQDRERERNRPKPMDVRQFDYKPLPKDLLK